MPYNKISRQDKERLYQAHLRGDDYVELANQLGIKRQTAWGIVRRAVENNGEVEGARGGVRQQRKKVTERLINEAVLIIEEHPEFTLLQINAELRVRLPDHQQIGRSTLANVLNGQEIVLKKLEDAPQEWNTDGLKEARFLFAQWIMEEAIHCELIFIDEAGINLWCKRNNGRTRRGQRAVRIVNGRRTPNLTITFAVSSSRGVLHHNLQRGGMTGDLFINFIQELCNTFPNDRQQRVLIFDNAPCHRRALQANIPETVTLRWLPPYSPFLNIVENAISKWKAVVKRNLAEIRDDLLIQPHEQRFADLGQICEQNARMVTPEDARGYFRHLQTYLPNCLLRHDILM